MFTLKVELNYGDGRITAELKMPSLQKALAACQTAPGGFVVIQGKLTNGGTKVCECGVTYSPPKAVAAPIENTVE